MQLLPIYNTRIGYVHKNSHKYIPFFWRVQTFYLIIFQQNNQFYSSSHLRFKSLVFEKLICIFALTMRNNTPNNAIVVTLDAGGTNFVFGAMRNYEAIGETITLPSSAPL